MLLAAAQLAAGDNSDDDMHITADGESSRRGRSNSTSSSSAKCSSTSSHHTEKSEDAVEASFSEHAWVLRFEAVRSQMGTFVLSRQTIMAHLRHVQGDVEAAVDSLRRAHSRRYTGSLRYLGGRRGDAELPDRVRNIPITYFRTGEQERRQAADIFFLLVSQLNSSRKPGEAIPLARSEAVLILDATGFDFEEALRLIQNRELASQILHIRFDNLRTRSGSVREQMEQDDAALAFYLTLTDRADMHSMQIHLAAHAGDIVAAIADWQQHGVDPVLHEKDRGQMDSESWVGRRRMIREDGHKMVLRSMPSSRDVHEYEARRLAWRQEPHVFALTTTGLGAALQQPLLRDALAERGNRPYAFIIGHDRDALARDCPNSRKFLIEYVEQGKYRSNGYDVINAGMKVRTGRYFWKGQGLTNTDNKPVFSVNNSAHLKHFNNMYRQGYHRPTGVLGRDPGTEWSAAEIERLWQLFAAYYEELVETARRTNQSVLLPFIVPEIKKKEIAQEIQKIDGEERTPNSIITMVHRHRKICKDFMFTFDTSNEVRRQSHMYRQMRQNQVDRVCEAAEKAGETLSQRDVLAAIERISGHFVPFEWDTYMPIDATPPARHLPSTGLPAVDALELRAEVEHALQTIPSGAHDALAWEQAAQVMRSFYRSSMTASDIAIVQPLLTRMGFRGLDIQALTEEEGLAIFEGLARREQHKQGRDLQEQLKSLVATFKQALTAGPVTMPAGGQVDSDDVQSFGVGQPDATDGWLTDQAIQAGLQTLSLRNTAVVDMHGARLHFNDPDHTPLPTIDTTAENIAMVMHFGNHWTVGVYNTEARQYHLLDSMPMGRQRFDIMAQRMDAVVAHYFPSHGQATWAPTRSFEQDNGRDCGLYVIMNVRSLDSGTPLQEVNSLDARIRILSEIMRLAQHAQTALTLPSRSEAEDEVPSDINSLGLAAEYFDPEYFD